MSSCAARRGSSPAEEIGSSTWVGSAGLRGSGFLPRAGFGGLPGLAPPLAGLDGRFLAPGLGAAFFCGRRLAASADASPSDLFFAIAACLPCTTKLRQGDHTRRVPETKNCPARWGRLASEWRRE